MFLKSIRQYLTISLKSEFVRKFMLHGTVGFLLGVGSVVDGDVLFVGQAADLARREFDMNES